MKHFLTLFILIGGFLYSQTTHQVGSTTLEEREVVDGLDVPWEIKWGPDDFLWVTEREGVVSRIDVETGQKYIILDIENNVWSTNEAGMLGMEFHPDFNNGAPYVFLVYTYASGGIKEKIVYYEYDAGLDQLVNEVVLLDGLDGNSTHIGCRLMALDDLTMLITTGDTSPNQPYLITSQDLNELTGKTLRMSIDVVGGTAGQIPIDNPFSGSLVWSLGHRNAQGLAMGPYNTIYSSEHGPSNDDELNILTAGANYGWPNVQGYCDNLWVDYGYAYELSSSYPETQYCADNNITESIWSSGSSTIATSDIIWYDHPSIPEFENTLLMTVLKNRMLVRFEFNSTGQEVTGYTEFFYNEWGRLRDICVSPDGKIYLATNGYSWPSQGPNEIIELFNPNFDYNSVLDEKDSVRNLIYAVDLLGRQLKNQQKGWVVNIYDNGTAEKKYISK